MNGDEIKRYWNERAAESRGQPNATTNDYYMRVIESRHLIEQIGERGGGIRTVTDVGCGDGLTTLAVAKAFPGISFVGLDYSVNMLASARQHLATSALGNVRFVEADIVTHHERASCDLAFSTRCLINLPTEEAQRTALRNIHGMLATDGTYVMIENFIDGHDAFNQVRARFGLPEIKVRDHDLFFDNRWFLPLVADLFDVVATSNISSTYYLVSRVIYSKICANAGVAPDYFDIHHELASQLPECGNFGPVKLWVLRKR